MKKKTMFQFFIKEKLIEEDIISLLSDIFGTSSINRLTVGDSSDIFYDYQHYNGNFNTSIEVYVSNQLAKKRNIDSDKALGLLVAKKLGTSVLISNEDINPYTWLLIEENKTYEAEQIGSDEDTMVIKKKSDSVAAIS